MPRGSSVTPVDPSGLQAELNALGLSISSGGGSSPISDGNLLANISGVAAFPIANTLSALMDHVFGYSSGSILYRGPITWAVLPPGSSGQLLQTGGSGSNPSWITSVTGLTSIAPGAVLANLTGSPTLPSGNSLSAIFDSLFGSAEGDVLYRGAAGWLALAPGSAGTILTSGGAGAIPAWSAAGAGLTSIADGAVVANISGSTAIPSGNSLSAVIDHALGSAEGDILYRGAGAWLALAPGTAGQILQTGGAAALPSWVNSGTGLTSVADGSVLSNISGGTALPGGNSLSAVIDHDLGSTEGDVLYRGASAWLALAPGGVGQVLTSGGAGAIPSWATPNPGLVTVSDSNVLANISGSSALPTATSVTALIDHAFGATEGDLLYRGAATWTALAPGTAGQILTTGGAGAIPAWSSAGAGLTSISDGAVVANISGGSAVPGGNSLSSVIDHDFSSTEGSILYRGASAWLALAPGTSGQVLQSGGAGGVPSWIAPVTGLSSIANNTILANISGSTALPVGDTLTAIIDSILGSAHGDMIFRGGSFWATLAPGVAGQVLQSGGPGSDVNWVTSGTGLTAIADGALLSNISGSTAVPSGNSLSAVIDHDIGSSEGDLLYRGVSAWLALAPGSINQVLTSGGAGAIPSWAAASSVLTAISDGDILANISGSSALPVANTVTALLDHALGATEGDILYRGASAWLVLAPGTAGQILQTGGAGAIPSWVNSGAGLTSVADGSVISNISGSTAIPSGNSLSTVIDHDLGSVEGDIVYRGAATWTVLPPGTAGQILTTGGAGAIPAWSAAGAGLTAISDGAIVSNISGGSAVPSGNALSAVIDHDFGSAKGDLLYRDTAAWKVLAPGTAGQILQSGGAGAIPSWVTSAAGNYLGSFATASLPASPVVASTAYATDATKLGEQTGSGTGTMVYYSNGWRVFSTDHVVSA